MQREAFLERIKQAVQAGNRPGTSAPLPERGSVGYQGAGDDAVRTLAAMHEAAGGTAHTVRDDAAAVETILDIVKQHQAKRVLIGAGKVVERLPLLSMRLAETDVTSIEAAQLEGDKLREEMFGADLGVTGVDHAIAETGSLVMTAKSDDPRGLSLLPPVHVAVVERGQIVPDLFDLFEKMPAGLDGLPEMPSALVLATGPSKTGDIELRLVTGVHGPGAVHLVLIDA